MMDISKLLYPPSALTWDANARVHINIVFGLDSALLLGPSLRHLPTSVFMLERDHECLHVQTHSHLSRRLIRMR
jgi:hypothetical protein